MSLFKKKPMDDDDLWQRLYTVKEIRDEHKMISKILEKCISVAGSKYLSDYFRFRQSILERELKIIDATEVTNERK